MQRERRVEGARLAPFAFLEEELGSLLGRVVELVTKESVVRSENWIRRNHILSTARVIYGS